ncbi:hypothetical protein GT037_010676 [Alternaria burnsii]|uniref:Heterokaryon incompatibility domain-containing protein n=1 Tax=Alternaria burnsii TaxID=1187904 RepID=A0A8H7AXV7_9PLEO|nr:uncharacterized protein GT037_010676 [Alternaria burnsii]KAF7671351.1 hypothetical protein GT037_010676 [Alternaria burnsii]
MQLQPGVVSAPLVCRLKRVGMENPPPYEALSYAWGQSTDVFTICQEPEMSDTTGTLRKVSTITRGLYEALIQLRHKTKSRILWVDAICIDQENLKERGEQVKIMRQIYAHAARVLVWLGPADDETAVALQEIARLKNHVASRGLSLEFLKAMTDEGPEFRMLGLTKYILDEKTFVILRRIYCRPWFQRIWVVQEVTAGGSSSEVHIGPHVIPWDDLGMVSLGLQVMLWSSPVPMYIEGPGLRNALVMWQGRLFAKKTPPTLLDEARKYLATDPRDMVYALYGFPAFQELFRRFGFKPDYTIQERELYERVTRLTIESSQTLEILHYVDNPELPAEESEWPFWVPRWNRPTLYWSFPLQDYAVYSKKTQGLLSVLEGPQGNLLRLKGVIVGRITEVAQCINWKPADKEPMIQNIEALTQFWDAISMHPDSLPDSKEDKFVGLAQALTAGLDSDSNSAAKSSARHAADAVDFLLHNFTTTLASSQVRLSALFVHLQVLRGAFSHGDRLRYEQIIVWFVQTVAYTIPIEDFSDLVRFWYNQT